MSSTCSPAIRCRGSAELNGADDLSPEALRAALGDRPFRSYPALLSTEADALAWARTGAPHGAIVAASYQASPRGRGGIPWEVDPGRDLAFSVIVRPELPPEREGWVYVVAAGALASAVGEESALRWPDEARRHDEPIGAIGVQAGIGPGSVEWAAISIWVRDAERPRAALLARLADEVISRSSRAPAELLERYRSRCVTLGQRVHVRVTGVGAGLGDITGRAVDVRDDGALTIETDEGRRVAVRPQHLWQLDELSEE